MTEKTWSVLREQSVQQFQLVYRSSRLVELEKAIRSKIPVDPSLLKEPIQFFSSHPGKRIRGLLTLLSCEVHGGQYPDALEAACGVEFIHSSSLILDDLPCMDNADSRRGQPCLHKQFGQAVAIMTAIFFLNKAFQSALSYNGLGTTMLERMNECVGEKGMLEGQLKDVLLKANDEATINLKTGSLMKLAVQLGVAVAGGSPEYQGMLSDFAENLGTVFQMQDDVLDGEGVESAGMNKTKLSENTAQSILINFGETEPAYALAGMVLYASNRSF